MRKCNLYLLGMIRFPAQIDCLFVQILFLKHRNSPEQSPKYKGTERPVTSELFEMKVTLYGIFEHFIVLNLACENSSARRRYN